MVFSKNSYPRRDATFQIPKRKKSVSTSTFDEQLPNISVTWFYPANTLIIKYFSIFLSVTSQDFGSGLVLRRKESVLFLNLMGLQILWQEGSISKQAEEEPRIVHEKAKLEIKIVVRTLFTRGIWAFWMVLLGYRSSDNRLSLWGRVVESIVFSILTAI